MRTARSSALRVLNLTIVAAIVLPMALFGYACWVGYRNAWASAEERIERSLDVVHEHALKVFEAVDLVFQQVDEIVGQRSDVDLRADPQPVHRRLKRIEQAVDHINSIWLFDRQGGMTVTSLDGPMPSFTAKDRDYFIAQRDKDAGTFIGRVLKPRATSRAPFIGVSRRLPSPDGTFAGITQISVLPMSFEQFYARIGHEPGMALTMVRDDGVVLARFPLPTAPDLQLSPESGFRRAIAADPRTTRYTAVSGVDGLERRFGLRKLAGYPIYLSASIETATVRREWMAAMATHLVFGGPATALLCLTLLIARRRTQTLYAEAERRAAAENALRQAQRIETIGLLTGGVAHDFNNLLMVITGAVRRLTKLPHDELQARSIEMISIAAKRGEALTRQLLTFARRQTLAPEVIDLAQQITELRELLRRSLRGDIEVRITAEADCRVKIDAGELELAVLNIAVNARDAMDQGGTLSIAVAPVTLHGEPALEGLHGAFVALSIIDTGVGIAPDVLPRVFEPFYTTKEVGKGTGLGLSQVYGFAKQSGGTATIASTPGRGTTVTLYLPRTEEPVPPAAPGQPLEPTPGIGRVALIVEDNLEVAGICRDYLEQLGFRTRHVLHAEAALAQLRQGERVDLVLSDILMPGPMNGLELAKEMRGVRPNLPIILATGYSASAERAARSGFPVLRKPYDIEALQRAVTTVMSASATA